MMKNNLKLLLILLGFALPYAFIYKAFFVGGPLAFGDAPYFYPENLKEFFNLPFLWNFRDNNFGSPQYYILWLYIPTFLYGLLNNLLGLGNDFLVRLIFYFPATVLAIFGSWKFIGKFNRDLWGRFFGAFLYGFNTYFLMLLDGGQVGIALAYGLFPLAAFYLLNYLSKLDVKNFIFALISLFALVSADVRIAGILILFVWGLQRTFKPLLILGLAVLGLSGYWVVPTIKAGFGGLAGVEGLGEGASFISLTNSLFLFQPHFPLNQFGTILSTPFYFAFVPLIIFGSLPLISKYRDFLQRRIILGFSLIFLLFVFLAKGSSDPFGVIYSWLVENIPLGISFRDSSKFYIPLFLAAGLLLSFTVSALNVFMKGKWRILAAGLIYVYLLLLISPALLGNLTGTLGKASGEPYLRASQKLKEDEGFARSLWFRERPPLAYADWINPALSADQLIKERPFASMNAGKYDYFNFLHAPQLNSWLKLLGVKYIFLPGDERKKIWVQDDLDARAEFLALVDSLPGLRRLEWAKDFPGYLIENPKPHIFAQKKAVFVVGGEDIYSHLDLQKDYLGSQGFVFLEEGRTNPRVLDQVDPDSVSIVFWDKGKTDLQMTFLQDKMVPVKTAVSSQWLSRASGDYLTWRYDLLKQGIESKEFDFGQGVAFSTVAGEDVGFDLKVPEKGSYYLGLRYTNASQSAGLKVEIPVLQKDILNDRPEIFTWEILGPFESEEGKITLTLTNLGGFVMLNTLALISEEEFKEADFQASKIVGTDGKNLTAILEEEFLPVKTVQVNPTEYIIEGIPQDARWLTFSDHYNPGWRFKNRESLNLPFYAMINGLYLPGGTSKETLYFSPQDDVRYGILVSAASLTLIIMSLVYFRLRRKD